MERVRGSMLMVLYEDTGCKAWDEPRDRHDPCPGKPQQKCIQAVTQMRVFDPTHHFSSLSLPILSTLFLIIPYGVKTGRGGAPYSD